MRRKTPESLTGIETLQPLQAAGFVGSRKTPESLTGIETKASSNSAIVRGSMVAKPPNPSQGLKPASASLRPGKMAVVAKPPNPSQGLKHQDGRTILQDIRRRKTPESLTGIETCCPQPNAG